MLKLGVHLPSSSLIGFSKMSEELEINTFQLFLRSPQMMNSKQKNFDKKDLDEFLTNYNGIKIFNVLGHAPFVANAASSKDFVRTKSIDIIKEDLETLNLIPNSLYVIHPGSHVGDGVDIGIERIIDIYNKAMFKEQETILLLETMAGKGSELGKNFDELAKIIKGIEYKDKIGVCLDTCHVWDAGYDLENDFDGVLEEFDEKIGLDKLKAIHLNNSLNDCGSRKDRHSNLYNGKISTTFYERILNDKRTKEIPFYLETPFEKLEDYKKDLDFLKNLIK